MAKDVATTDSNFLETLDPRVANALGAVGIVNAPVEVHDVEEITGGWRILKGDAKRRLIGLPLTIVKMTFNDSDYGKIAGEATGQFVVLHVVTDEKDPQFFVVVDGGKGLYESSQRWVERFGDPEGQWIKCPNGFRVSDYTYTDKETGEESPAATFYFD